MGSPDARRNPLVDPVIVWQQLTGEDVKLSR